MLSSHTQNKATPFQNFNYSNFLITNHLINKHPFPMARKSSPEYLSPEIVNRGINDSGPHAGSPSFSVKVRRGLPDFLSSVNLKYVKLGYSYLIKHGVYFIGLPFIVGILCGKLTWDVFAFEYSVMSAIPLLGSLGLALYALLDLAPRSTYLVDFACYLPPDELKITKEEYIHLAEKSGQFDETAIDFQRRALKTSGLGDETYLPRAVFRPDFERDLRHGREEAAQQMFGAVDNLLSATGIKTKDIRILIVNCGMLNTTPSLSAMVINHYKLSHRIQSFNLGGMGCAASVTAVDLANDLLSAYPGSYALVVSTEVVSFTWYGGSELDMVLPNCFFRVGASAVLLSNRHVDRWRAKYQLKQLVRTHKGTDNKSFRSIQMKEDTQGRQGLSVSKDLIEVGGRALKANITTLGPLVLPVSEQFNFFKSLIFRRQSSTNSRSSSDRHYKPYIPDYKLAFKHVCILATSKKVLDEIQKNLDLTDEYMEASRRTLERFGNTSSSSIWYELAYLEARGMVESGDRIWQLALGSGLKCNSVVWKAVRNVRKVKENPWVGL